MIYHDSFIFKFLKLKFPPDIFNALPKAKPSYSSSPSKHKHKFVNVSKSLFFGRVKHQHPHLHLGNKKELKRHCHFHRHRYRAHVDSNPFIPAFCFIHSWFFPLSFSYPGNETHTHRRPLFFPDFIQQFHNVRHYSNKGFQSCILPRGFAIIPLGKESVDLRIPTCRFADE